MKTPSSDTGGSQPLNFPIQIDPSSSEWENRHLYRMASSYLFLHFSLYTFPKCFPQPLQAFVFDHVP